ncbi:MULTISPECIES: polysaccharide pyruvyl transferase family protein [Methanobacterium]|uniref:Polysaccharide pyruvyl transferase domain-containing protein n=1 Tax=Methanobacterium bryantii TaxID=2161 RepID=A0A2A2HAI5_METBR|nr:MULTISPECIES: polysaccharide pyruvyl transferase family protein [Methanobacterium]OEC88458.1 hypothetical protein A9507_04185 [Methanobacterium sp. A39]PAV06387.1 hypothetical protein ASJ80_16340 [Methanobacterium bryantii]
MGIKRIGLLHGAILNGGDYLICKRGTKLLNKYLGSKFELVHIKRWKPFKGNFDALIILGGPIISRNMHVHSMRIKEYLDDKKIPVVALGIGVSGEPYGDIDEYFTDESLNFWRDIYESSNLISVRDEQTYSLLKHLGIDARLTGCPALFDLDNIGFNNEFNIKKGEKLKVSLTIPNIKMDIHSFTDILFTFKDFLLILFFISYVKMVFKFNKIDNESYLVLQHGFNSMINLICAYSNLFGIKRVDASKRSLDEIKEIKFSDIHIGTRLHCNIHFLSNGKPSYLFNVDNRTSAFLKTINNDFNINFSFSGIIELVKLVSKELKDVTLVKNRVIKSDKTITNYFKEMSMFLLDVEKFMDSTYGEVQAIPEEDSIIKTSTSASQKITEKP